jgi:hypothetical protein
MRLLFVDARGGNEKPPNHAPPNHQQPNQKKKGGRSVRATPEDLDARKMHPLSAYRESLFDGMAALATVSELARAIQNSRL